MSHDNLLAIKEIFDVELVPTVRGEEFYFKPKAGWTLEKWAKGTAAFCEMSKSSLEQYNSGTEQVYRPTKVTPEMGSVIQFITGWSEEYVCSKIEQFQKDIDLYGDNKDKILAGFVDRTTIYPWPEQNSFFVIMHDVQDTEDRMIQLLSFYSEGGVQKAPSSEGTMYYPTNPQDAKFLKFVADIRVAQEQIQVQAQANTGRRQLQCGGNVTGHSLHVAGMPHKPTSIHPSSSMKTDGKVTSAAGAHTVAGRFIGSSAFAGKPAVQIARGGGLVNSDADTGHASGR